MKQSKFILTISGALLTIIGLIVTIIGYNLNTDHEVTKEDKLIYIGFFLIMVGIILLVNAVIGLLSKQNAVIYTKTDRTKRLAYAALFATLSYIVFEYLRIDISIAGSSSAFHLGNTFVVLAALFLGGTWGGMAGAVGLTLADLASPQYIVHAPKTFFLKLCIGLIVGLVAHTILHISRAQSRKKVARASLIAAICGMAFNFVADPFVGYFYKRYLLGIPQDMATTLAKLSSLTTGVNAILSVIFAFILYNALRPALVKSGLFFCLEKDSVQEK